MCHEGFVSLQSDQSTSTGAPDEDITVPTVELVHPEPGGDCR